MRTAGLPDFRKIWGRIDHDIEPGYYSLEIDNSYKSKKIMTLKSLMEKNISFYQKQDH